MKTVPLSGSLRKSVGKEGAKALRKRKQVPAVVYGLQEQKHFSIDEVALEKFIYTPDVYMINLDLEGDQRKVIIKDYQQHPVTDKMLHVDFFEIADDKEVEMQVPIEVFGNPVGVMNGGRLRKTFRRLYVKGLPPNIPNKIEIEIGHLKIEEAVHVSDLDLNVEIMHPDETVVVAVKAPRSLQELEALETTDDEEGEEDEEAAEGEEGAEDEDGSDDKADED